MNGILKRKSWSPYVVGAGIGLLETAAMATAKRPLGITSTFEDMAVLASQAVAKDAMGVKRFVRKRGVRPRIDWQWGLVAGVLAGSNVSSMLSGDRRHTAVPRIWRRSLGRSRLLRYAGAMAGGALMMFGARVAEGCSSGHGISGAMQFAASSSMFNPIAMLAGSATALALFGRK